MAQWYAQLVFKGDALLGEGLSNLSEVTDVARLEEAERYTTVIVSGYALYGQLRGYYALGVAHLGVDPTGRTAYLSEASALHTEPLSTLTETQRATVRDWLMKMSSPAWENSSEIFKQELH